MANSTRNYKSVRQYIEHEPHGISYTVYDARQDFREVISQTTLVKLLYSNLKASDRYTNRAYVKFALWRERDECLLKLRFRPFHAAQWIVVTSRDTQIFCNALRFINPRSCLALRDLVRRRIWEEEYETERGRRTRKKGFMIHLRLLKQSVKLSQVRVYMPYIVYIWAISDDEPH